MNKNARTVVALVSGDGTPSHLRGALEQAGYEVPLGYARDFRESNTAFSTFCELYKPDVIVVDLHPPAEDALKDILSFKALPQAEGRAFVLGSSHAATRKKLPEHVNALAFDDDAEHIVRAVRQAISERKVA